MEGGGTVSRALTANDPLSDQRGEERRTREGDKRDREKSREGRMTERGRLKA